MGFCQDYCFWYFSHRHIMCVKRKICFVDTHTIVHRMMRGTCPTQERIKDAMALGIDTTQCRWIFTSL